MSKIFKHGLLVVALLALPLLLAGCTKTIKLSDYIKYDVDGYEGHGTIKAEFNYRALMNDAGIAREDARILTEFEVEADVEEKLSNGDEVLLTVDVPSGAENSLKMKFTDRTLKITVDGLKEIKEKDPFKDISLIYSGMSGMGTVTLDIGESDLPATMFIISKMTDLSNNEVITVSLKDFDQEAFVEEYQFIPVPTEKEFTVSGLEDVPTRSYFDDISITFSGTEPLGTLMAENKSGAILPLNEFFADKTEGLSNGDTVTLSLANDNDYYFNNYGFMPTERERTYTVEGLTKFVTSLSEIPEATITAMDKAAQGYMSKYVQDYWSSKAVFYGMTYLGNYFLHAKVSTVDVQNRIILVYRIETENDKSNGRFNYYWYMSFDNLVLLPDGTCSVDLSYYGKPHDRNNNYYFTWDDTGDYFYSGGDSYVYNGYEQIESLFSQQVTANTGTYDYESTVNVDTQASDAAAAAPAQTQDSQAQESAAEQSQTTDAQSSEGQQTDATLTETEPINKGYVTMKSQIPADTLESLKADTEARMRERESWDMDAGETLTSVTYMETVLMVSNDGSSPHNALYVIFRLTCNNGNGEFSWYDCFRYTDLTLDEQGNVGVDFNTAEGLYDRHKVEDNKRQYYYYYTGYGTLEEIRSFAETELGNGYSVK